MRRAVAKIARLPHWSFLIAVLLAAVGLFLVLEHGFSDSEAGGTRRVALGYHELSFPDGELLIGVHIWQEGWKLWISLDDIRGGSGSIQAGDHGSGSAVSDAGLKWQAVRIDIFNSNRDCNAHAFLQHAEYGVSHAGDFSFALPPITTNAGFIDLDSSDHSSNYCFRIESALNGYVYTVTKEPIYVKRPQTKVIQEGDRLYYLQDALDTWPAVRYRFARVDDDILRSFEKDEPFGLQGNGCNRNLFAAYESSGYVSRTWLLNMGVRTSGIQALLSLSEDMVGDSFCIEFSSSAIVGLHWEKYVLTHKITDLSASTHYSVPSPGENSAPESYDLEAVVDILKDQLTPEGLRLLDETEIKLFTTDSSAAGFYATGTGQIYLSRSHLFPDYYHDLNGAQQQFLTRFAVGVLAHEFMHHVDFRNGFKEVYRDCQKDALRELASDSRLFNAGQAGNRWSGIIFSDPDWNEVSVDNAEDAANYWLFWRYFNECLEADSDHGDIYAAIRNFNLSRGGYVDRTGFSYGKNALFNSLSITNRWHGSTEDIYAGGERWYSELYAESAITVLALPEVLEDHYDRFFLDRSGFAANYLNANTIRGQGRDDNPSASDPPGPPVPFY